MRNKGGLPSFTLVELLVLVAILSVLALMAGANWEMARVRARLAQVQIEHHYVGTAVELHHVDRGAHPFQGPNEEGGFLASVALAPLTTPVAFIPGRGMLRDPFAVGPAWSTAGVPGMEQGVPYLYANYEQFAGRQPWPWSNAGRFRGWALTSVGPDGRPENLLLAPAAATMGPGFFDAAQVLEVLYDPTNGTTSAGGVINWGGWIPGSAATLLR